MKVNFMPYGKSDFARQMLNLELSAGKHMCVAWLGLRLRLEPGSEVEVASRDELRLRTPGGALVIYRRKKKCPIAA